MSNNSLQTTCNSTGVSIFNKNISIEGNKKCLTRKYYYKKYYTRVNDIYVVNYVDRNGKFLYKAIYIVPRGIKYDGKKYLGSNSKMEESPNK